MTNPVMDKFFKLGEKATGGDPVRKALFDYMLMGIVFVVLFAFMSINLYNFITTFKATYLLSALLFGAFVWFDYWAVLAFRGMYLSIIERQKKKDEKVESYDEMMAGFKNNVMEVKK